MAQAVFYYSLGQFVVGAGAGLALVLDLAAAFAFYFSEESFA